MSSNKRYIEKYGYERGWRISRTIYKNYTHFALINNGLFYDEEYREHVQEASRLFGMTFVEEKGQLDFIIDILNQNCDMVVIPPTR